MFGHYFAGGLFCQDLNYSHFLSAYKISLYETQLFGLSEVKAWVRGWNFPKTHNPNHPQR